jgi:hypothetical protein
MTALTQATTDGQVEQTQRVVADAVRKALKPLGKEASQRVHARGNELAAGVAKFIAELSVSNQFADEQIETGYNYPANYRVKPLAKQIETLAKLFNLDGRPASMLQLSELPEEPKAGSHSCVPALSPNYGEAVEKVLGSSANSVGSRTTSTAN